ncbi:excalibur calcium-binding domain-containing protein [Sphingomonas jaspsi]|uniref:excalibur calcium-binding domain-containing protein n=1 Tax=Sphingomonas jaspsi TaxID=392409 RepID=UPI001C54D8CD|nr:excalibur calcium-binding domain-containing protein [Sphingomonas jaspsi]
MAAIAVIAVLGNLGGEKSEPKSEPPNGIRSAFEAGTSSPVAGSDAFEVEAEPMAEAVDTTSVASSGVGSTTGFAPSTQPSDEPWNSDFQCGAKRYCTQMNSCEEAQFHFRQCGLSRLDGDSDGIPCEDLCGA